MLKCGACAEPRPKGKYSKSQLKNKGKRKCRDCTAEATSRPPPHSRSLMTCGCVGCHVVDESTPWLLGVQRGGVGLSEEAPEDLRRAALATEDHDEDFDQELVHLEFEDVGADGQAELMVMNVSAVTRVSYVSATASPGGPEHLAFRDRTGRALSVGWTSDPEATQPESPHQDHDTATSSRRKKKKNTKSKTHPSAPAAGLVPCLTLVVVIPPHSMMRICTAQRTEHGPDLYNFTFKLSSHPDPEGALQAGGVPALPGFPLGPPPAASLAASPAAPAAKASASSIVSGIGSSHHYLCTQSTGGRLTHFFPESYHAFDLRCAEATPVLAVGDGVITEVQQTNEVTGVHCSNLAAWNSISLALFADQDQGAAAAAAAADDDDDDDDDDEGVKGSVRVHGHLCRYLMDYVHIQPNSATVAVGDVVRKGQVICSSGKVGFAPEPHLHVELHLAAAPQGPSLRFRLQPEGGGEAYEPVAGRHYGPSGPMPLPSASPPGPTPPPHE